MAVLVGKPAPDFRCPAVLGSGEIVQDFHLASAIQNKYALLFFYSLDAASTCPPELIALERHMDAFITRNIEVIAIAIDSHFTQNTWRDAAMNNSSIETVRYTMAADLTQHIVRDYDVQTDRGVAYRAAFLLDPRGVVRCQMVNDLPLRHNIDELLRLMDVLQRSTEKEKSQ